MSSPVVVASNYPARVAPSEYHVPYIYGRPVRTEQQKLFASAIQSEIDQCILWPFNKDEDGYARMRYAGKSRRASRIVCLIAHGEPPEDRYQAAHSCGVTSCINPKHISWKTPLDNSHDKIVHGTHKFGESTFAAKLTEADVLDIRRLIKFKTYTEIGAQYGISDGTLWKIVTRRSWRHI